MNNCNCEYTLSDGFKLTCDGCGKTRNVLDAVVADLKKENDELGEHKKRLVERIVLAEKIMSEFWESEDFINERKHDIQKLRSYRASYPKSILCVDQ